MSVYLIVEAKEIFDPKLYGEYVRQVPALIEKFGGKYLARGGAVTVLSGDWEPARLIVIEFESRERLQQWWDSPEYRKVAPLRERGARTNAIVVDGVS